MNKKSCFFLLLFLPALVFGSAREPAVLSDKNASIDLSEQLEVFRDPDGKASFSEIQKDSLLFAKPAPRMTFREGQTVYWIRFSIRNDFDSDREFLALFDNSWQEIEFYAPGSGEWSRQTTGMLIPVSKRSLPVPHAAVMLLLRKGTCQNFYARLTFRGTWHTPKTFLSACLLKDSYLNSRSSQKFIQALFLGALLVMALYNLVLYISLRDKTYISYVFLLVSACLVFMTNYRYDFEYLFPENPALKQWLQRVPFYNLILGSSVLIFAQTFLNTRRHAPVLHAAMNLLNAILVFHFLLCVFQFVDNGWLVSDLLGIPVLCMSLIGGVSVWRRGHTPARFYVIATLFSCCGTVFYLLESNFQFLSVDVGTYPMQIGIASELVLYSMALGSRIRLLLNEVAAEQAKVIDEFVENEKLRDKIRQELEEKIRERARVSKDIHDELGAGLSKIHILSEAIQLPGEVAPYFRKLDVIRKTACDLLDNMRGLIDLYQQADMQLELVLIHIREYASDYLEDFPIRIDFDFPVELPAIPVPAEYHRQSFLICKEALHNSVKHSGADALTISARYDKPAGELTIAITDNGRGFEQEKQGKGNGLGNMQHRAQTIGGRTQIKSRPGAGCAVILKLTGIR